MKNVILFLSVLCVAGCAVFGRPAPQTYNIFFRPDSTVLSPTATAIVDQAASAIHKYHPAQVILGAGVSPGDDPSLAQGRFETVQRGLIEKGVDPALIARATLAEETIDLLPTADRRVEIRLVAESR